MLHAQALSTLADLAVHNELSSCHDDLLHVEEIEPSECDTRRERRIFSFLNLGFEAPQPSEPAEDRLSDPAAQTERDFRLGIRKAIEASAVLVTPRVMLQQTAQGTDTEFS
jgi:hypothetical protein